MENIIKKAIDGGYNVGPIEVDMICDNKYPHFVIDPLFWQSLGKACGWGLCNNPDHGFIQAMAGVKSSDINRLGCPVCGHDPERIIDPNEWQEYAIIFYTTNLTQGWDKAVEYLEDLIK